MECITIKPGMNCVFMKKTGCSFNGGACHPIVENCVGCGYVMENAQGNYCQLYADPATKWVFGRCNFATHVKGEVQPSAQRLNPLDVSHHVHWNAVAWDTLGTDRSRTRTTRCGHSACSRPIRKVRE